ncbi:unnamed protein product [Ilex paraguariensis]|uniref:TF-B3 domain-containing protein n=1 Tax=Ilex paraguariensis TaxID=185542 RepID=A0ABC8QTN2_9AQUA
MAGHAFCFTKKLSPTDVSRNLEIPNGALDLPQGNEIIHVLDPTGETTWEFICSTRSGGRRLMTYQWRNFAEKKRLMPGDVLRLQRSTIGNVYLMELERRSIRLFGKGSFLSILDATTIDFGGDGAGGSGRGDDSRSPAVALLMSDAAALLMTDAA